MSTSDSKKVFTTIFDRVSQEFYTMIIKSSLNCPIDFEVVTIISFWICFFQVSSFMISFESNGNSLAASQINWEEGWKVLVYIVRPIQFIYQQYNQQSQGINIIVIVAFFMNLALQATIAIIGAVMISKPRNVKSGYQILSIFVNTSIYFNSIFNIMITEAILLLLIKGTVIKVNSDSLNSNSIIVNRVCGGILLILYQCYSFMNSKFYELSYQLQENGLQRYCQDNLSILLNHLRVVVVFGYAFDETGQKNGPLIVAISGIIYMLVSLYEYLGKKPFSKISKSEHYAVALVCNLVFLSFMILDKYISLTSNSQSICFILVLLPIILKLSIDFVKNVNDKFLYQNLLEDGESNQSIEEQISRKISMIFNNRQQILNSDHLKFFGLYELHKQSCKRSLCFCKFQLTKCSEDTQFLLSNDILKRYVRFLIRTELVQSNLNEKIERLVFFIRYMTNLSVQKKHSFAISKVIDFINESDRMRKSYGIYIKVCIDTVLNVLKSIMFKNIGQMITDDEVEQQLVDIDMYIRMDMEKTLLKNIVNKCIQKRIEIFEKMRKNFEDFTELEKMNSEYNSYLDELESKFHIFYEKFPTKQNQSFYIFFQAEVKGNLKKAISVSNTRKFQSQIPSKKLFNVFQPNVLYLTSTMGKIWGKIVNFSDKLPSALGYNKQEFNYVTHIKDIMPTSIATIHDDIIRCMMTQGNDTIVNNLRQIFLKNKCNLLIRVNVFIALNLYYSEELPFGVFVTPIETRSGFLFVTSQGNIEGLDQGILNQVGHNNVQNVPSFFQFKVLTCLPEFDSYQVHMAENNLSLWDKQDVPFNFFSKSHPQFMKIFSVKSQSMNEFMNIQSQTSMRGYSELESSARQSMRKVGSNVGFQSNLLKFKADITIERHKIKMLDSIYIYFIVEIKYLMRVANNEEYYTMSSSLHENTPRRHGSASGFNKQASKSLFGSRRNIPPFEGSFQQLEGQNNNDGLILETHGDLVPGMNKSNLLQVNSQPNELLNTSFNNTSMIANSDPTERAERNDQAMQTLETLRSAIKDEINIDLVHNTGRKASLIDMKEERQENKNLNQQGNNIKTLNSVPNSNLASVDTELSNNLSKQIFIKQVSGGDKGFFGNPISQQDAPLTIDTSHLLDQSRLSNQNLDISQMPLASNENTFSHMTKRLEQYGIETAQKLISSSNNENSNSNIINPINIQGNSGCLLIPLASLEHYENRNENDHKQENNGNQIHQDIQLKIEKNYPPQDSKNYYKKKSYSLKNQDQKFDLKKLLQKDEREGSLTSSTDTLNKSMDKYNYYEEFISSRHEPLNLKMVKYGRVLEYILLLVATIASIITLYTSFDSLLSNIDTLTLHSNIMHPYGNSLILQNTLYLLYSYGSASIVQQQKPILQTRQDTQYSTFQTMIQEEWKNNYLKSYFSDQVIGIYDSHSLQDILPLQETTLLSATSRLLYGLNEVKYYSQAEVLKQMYLPEREFLAVNYPKFVQFFNSFVQETLDSSISYNKTLLNDIIVQTVILNIITLLIFILSSWNYYHYQKSIMSILKMCQTATTISVENEMHRYQHLQQDLAENEDILFSYTFSIQQKEKELLAMSNNTQIENQSVGQSASNGQLLKGGTKRKKLLVNVQNDSLEYWRFAIFIIFCYSLFVAFTISSYALNTSFLQTFEPAIIYYKQIADSNYQVSQLQTIRILIDEYTWLSNDATRSTRGQYLHTQSSQLQSLMSDTLNSFLYFSTDMLRFHKIDFFSNSFKDSMDNLVQQNICTTSDDKLDSSYNPQRCNTVMQGVLTQGLQNAMSKWQEQLSVFKSLQYIESSSGATLLDLQLDQEFISVTLTNFTLSMRNMVKNSLSSNTQAQKDLNLIISISFITLVSFVYGYELYFGIKMISKRFVLAKKVIYLVPVQTAMIEETFIKILKSQSTRLEIIK